MKGYEHIHKGSRIDTMDGYIILKERNDGGLYYADEFTINPDTEEAEYTGIAKLTKAEVERTMKETDGRNHYIVWEEEYES